MKILQFFGEPLSYGGQEAFIINMYKNFKDSTIKYTFATPFFANNKELIELIDERNDRLIKYDKSFYSIFRKKYIINCIKTITEKDNYDIIHIHSGSIFTLYYVSKIAKKQGIKKVIVHSHATGINNVKHKIIKSLCNINFTRYADYFLACSIEAGKFKYSKKIMNSNKFKVIKNGIDLNKYNYNFNARNMIRKRYGIENKIVLCNIGRFSKEKNQLFLLKIFKEYLKENKNGYLLIIGGEGPMERKISTYIKKNHLNDKVLVLKERDDVNDFLNAADLFVFPSRFEGLGISVIEAQATGLYSICSEKLPEETQVTNNYIKISLKEPVKKWVSTIKEKVSYERKSTTAQIRENGFDVKDSAKELEKYYMEV